MINYCSEDTRPGPRAGADCYYFCGSSLDEEAEKIRASLRARGAWDIRVLWCDTAQWTSRHFDVEWTELVDGVEAASYEPVAPNPGGPALI